MDPSVLLCSLQSPSLCAGLAAYPSWALTLRRLARPGGPACFFTDFCEEAAHRAATLARELGCGQPAVPLRINSFRHPVRIVHADNALPSYSNAFLFAFG
jgi:hypothetical protein